MSTTSSTQAADTGPTAPVSSGIPGLDEVLAGGFTPHRFYMIQGLPGSGKTTLALQFLMEGVRRGESVLYVTLSETEEEIRSIADSHGWSLEGVQILEVVPSEDSLSPQEQYTVFQPDEVELGETTKAILSEVEQRKPTRVAFDSLSEKRYFAGRRCTVIVLDDCTGSDDDPQLQSIAHGIIELQQSTPMFGFEWRQLRIVKYRGVKFVGGYHDFRIRRGGVDVFPRLIAGRHRRAAEVGSLSSGVPALDELLGRGLERGASTLLSGAPGTGKSTVAAQGHRRGRRSHAGLAALRGRADRLGRAGGGRVHPPRQPAGRAGRHGGDGDRRPQRLRQCHASRQAAQRAAARAAHLPWPVRGGDHHGQCAAGVIGTSLNSPVDASYLADTVLLLRYFEAHGSVRSAISVLEKRSGQHERAIREFEITPQGLRVGPPLLHFHGVLTGVPRYTGGTLPEMSAGKT